MSELKYETTLRRAADRLAKASLGLPPEEAGQDGTLPFLASSVAFVADNVNNADDNEVWNELITAGRECLRWAQHLGGGGPPDNERRVVHLLRAATLLSRAAGEMLVQETGA